jgi:hypothetical protein
MLPGVRLRGSIYPLLLAAGFLAAHLALLPATLEDIDSINFALALDDFDVAKHQPHPPGHPVFVALGRISGLFTSSDALALAFWGALLGALAAFPLLWLFEAFAASEIRPAGPAFTGGPPAGRDAGSRGRTVARLAVLVALASPLFWFTAHRPMSDVPGLAVALAAQACLATAWLRGRAAPPEAEPRSVDRLIVAGAFLAALGIGLRVQSVWLTVPLLGLVLLQRVGRGAPRVLLPSAAALAAGLLLWAVPLVADSGGLEEYRTALAAQTAEDLSGADLLVRSPTPRRLAFGLLQTFVYPWATVLLGSVVFALATVGGFAVLLRGRAALLLIGTAAVPYAIFHLLFQETPFIRYALPLVPPIAYLAVRGASLAGARVCAAATAALVAWSLVLTLPSSIAYARDGSPGFVAVEGLTQAAKPPATIALHHSIARTVQARELPGFRVLAAPPMREWLELTGYWRSGGRDPVWFLANPSRMDLELIDPLSRRHVQRFRWTFPRLSFVSGVRPDLVDLVQIESPPGWFAEEGWHLTSEVLNISERRAKADAVAYVRRRDDPAWMFIGGRHAAGDRAAAVTVALDDRAIDTWTLEPGRTFFRRIALPPGALQGPSDFARLVVSYTPVGQTRGAPDPAPSSVRVWFTEFGVQSPEDLVVVPHEGWHEIEFGRDLERRWRWMSGRARTFVHAGGRDVTLRIIGESPLRYFDAAPDVIVRAGDTVLARATPASDFTLDVPIPAAALAASDGTITIETSRTFVPAEQSDSPDGRELGLRIFGLEIDPDATLQAVAAASTGL